MKAHLVLAAAVAIALHPLHTSFAQVTFARDRTVEVSLRVFVDDFTVAAEDWATRQKRPAGISAEAGYAVESFILRESNGRRVSLAFCGQRRRGDLMWICLRGALTSAPRGSLVSSRVMFEKFSDQVNVVQMSYEGRKTNLVFSSDDSEKPIP